MINVLYIALIAVVFIIMVLCLWAAYPIVRIDMRKSAAKDIDEVINAAGFEYDPENNIYISRMNPWQRRYGYRKLYDNAAPFMGMIVDREPVYFECSGKRWLIEFWKGQYGITTGFEVGVYYSDDSRTKNPQNIHYKSAEDYMMPKISMTAYKNGEKLFTRTQRHWWLTGFILGSFCKPKKLSMDVAITFNDNCMARSFLNALIKMGYQNLYMWDNTVQVYFNKPRTKKVFTRLPIVDFCVLLYLKCLTKLFNRFLAKPYTKLTGRQVSRYFGWMSRHRGGRNEQD